MAWGSFKATEKTGTFACEVTDYLIKENNLEDASLQFKCRLEELIVENNGGHYCFPIGQEINVPLDQSEAILSVTEPVPMLSDGVSSTTSQRGWKLCVMSKDGTGVLVRGNTGWLIDENGLYILKDGRRLTQTKAETEAETEAKKTGGKEIRFGNKAVAKGFKDIFGFDADWRYYYFSEDLLNEILNRNLLTVVDPVVIQALQTNICYGRKGTYDPIQMNTNAVFYSIGRDETNIPIVVTRVGDENAPKKIVIAGSHGNERNARFAVLETQMHFIASGLQGNDLVLYFIPAMSPTMFFADARGLPLDSEGNYLKDVPAGKIEAKVREKVREVLTTLTIPKLHDDIASKIEVKEVDNGQEKKTNMIWQDAIQRNQLDSTKPIYGIDTNRDCYNILPSTECCLNFFVKNKENMTVFMLHGYERLDEDRVREGFNSGYQCTLAGPYEFYATRGCIDESIMDQMDVITSLIFGYRYKRGEDRLEVVDYSTNYFFDRKTAIGIEFNGEWSRKLYLDTPDLKILCFDIEMGENYREGSRNQIGGRGDGSAMNYEPRLVTDRRYQNNMPFFDPATARKFYATNKIVVFSDGSSNPATLSFNDFLLKYHSLCGKKFPME